MPPRKARTVWRVAGVRLDTGETFGYTEHRSPGGMVILDLGPGRRTTRSSPGVIRPPDVEAHVEVQLDQETGNATWVGCSFPGGLTPSDLQRLPWATYLAVADAANQSLSDRSEDGLLRHRDGAADWHLTNLLIAETKGEPTPKRPRIKRRPGRAGHPDSHYVEIAQRYQELYAKGVTSPTITIAKERHVARETAAGWIRTARLRGHLPPARRGKAGWKQVESST